MKVEIFPKLQKKIGENKRKVEIISLAIIILLAIFFRFFQINSTPPGLYADAAANGLDGLDINNGTLKIFFERNAGREAIYYYIVAAFQLFTKDYFILYVVTAFLGVLTVIIHYFVIKGHFGRKIGLISTFLLSISFYHVIYSRLGYRNMLMPIFVLLVFNYFMHLVKKRTVKYALLFGIVTALG
ncbi:MAG TPA: hypothetical protein ENI23_01350, partial [bacterium]|nr:hypothetical protein [bacterium]